jgi:hypothetical protein
MIKLSDVRRFLNHVSGTLRTLAEEREQNLQKIASLELELGKHQYKQRIEKIAENMEDKGPFQGSSLQERMAYIEKAAADGAKLETLEQAVGMIARDGSLGTLAKEKAAGNSKAGFISSILEE